MNKLTGALGALSIVAALAACGGGGGAGGGGDVGDGPPVDLPVLAWQGAQSLESSAELAERPHVAVNASGIGYAVWEQEAAGQREVMARRYANGLWEPVQLVTGTVDVDANDPQVAVLPNGQALVVWLQETQQGRRIAYQTSTPSGNWLGGVDTVVVAGDEVSDLKVVANASGATVAIWSENVIGNSAVVRSMQYSPVTSKFGIAEQVNADNTDATAPDVAIDSSGRVLATWLQAELGKNTVRVRPKVNGAWLNERTLSDGRDSLEPRVALGRDGRAIVALVDTKAFPDDVVDNVRFAIANDFAGDDWHFNGNTLPSSVQSREPTSLRVVMSEQGDATLAWTGFLAGDGQHNLLSARVEVRGSGAGLTINARSLGPIEFNANHHANLPQLASDAAGRVLAVWQQVASGVQVRMMSNRLVPGATQWGTPEIIDNTIQGNVGNGNAALAFGPSGPAIAIWEQKGPVVGHADVQANVLK